MPTTHTTESTAQVATAACHVTRGSSSSTNTAPAVTTRLAATTRGPRSKVTVANAATMTAPTAAAVTSYPASAWMHRNAVEATTLASGDHQSAARLSPLATVSRMSAAPSSW